MVRGHQVGCIEVVVRYQLVGCVCLTKVPFQPLMKLQVQGQVRIVRLMCMCVVFYLAYTFPKRKVKSGVGELRDSISFIYN